MGVLGNHEYGYNISAQLLMSKNYKNWWGKKKQE